MAITRPDRRDHYITPATGPDADEALDKAIEALAIHRNFGAFADTAATIHLVTSIIKQAEQRLTQLVTDARNEQLSWAGIGDLLGVSRSSAWQKYSPTQDNQHLH